MKLYFRLNRITHISTVILILGLIATIATSAATEPPAQTLVRTTAEALLERLRAEAAEVEANPALADEIATEIVLPHFDFEVMSGRALGHFSRDMTADQRTRFVAEFRELLLHTYAHTLIDYRDSEIKFLPARQLGPAAYRVRTEVVRPTGGAPLQVDYEARAQNGTDWKVVDVTLNGVSLAISYRAGFAHDIPAIGIDGVIAQLAAKNEAPTPTR
jgi:phospholipid transport system substrate-binding protein